MLSLLDLLAAWIEFTNTREKYSQLSIAISGKPSRFQEETLHLRITLHVLSGLKFADSQRKC
jgi:hypothetical protein